MQGDSPRAVPSRLGLTALPLCLVLRGDHGLVFTFPALLQSAVVPGASSRPLADVVTWFLRRKRGLEAGQVLLILNRKGGDGQLGDTRTVASEERVSWGVITAGAQVLRVA